MIEDQQKKRSNTVSTTLSDKHVSKKPRYSIPEPQSKYFCVPACGTKLCLYPQPLSHGTPVDFTENNARLGLSMFSGSEECSISNPKLDALGASTQLYAIVMAQ
jgi:hypothetical protein